MKKTVNPSELSLIGAGAVIVNTHAAIHRGMRCMSLGNVLHFCPCLTEMCIGLELYLKGLHQCSDLLDSTEVKARLSNHDRQQEQTRAAGSFSLQPYF